MHTEPQSLLVLIFIISITTTVKCKELIMKGVRRQRHTGCMQVDIPGVLRDVVNDGVSGVELEVANGNKCVVVHSVGGDFSTTGSSCEPG